MSEALRRYRICDFTGQLAGAGATKWLAAFGAEVIRIDRAGSDPTVTERVSGRGKKSVVVNLKDPAGVERHPDDPRP